jgi:hypothetical protein
MTTATPVTADRPRLALGLRSLGAGALLVEGAVHVQQYVQIFSTVSWIGPLFILNAIGCAVAAAGLMSRRTASLAAAAGVVISVAALLALAKSFHGGLLGWEESTLRPAIWIAMVSEAAAASALGGLLLAAAAPRAWLARVASPDRPPVAGPDPRLAR